MKKIVPIGGNNNIPKNENNVILGIIFSIRSILNILVICSILITGGVLMAISFFFNINSLNASVAYKLNEVNSVMTRALDDYLGQGVAAVNYLSELEEYYGKRDTYSLSKSPYNSKVTIMDDSHQYLKTVESYVKSNNLLIGRYVEMDINGLAAMYENNATTYVSINSDKSLYTYYPPTDNIYSINDTEYIKTVSAGQYGIYTKEWFADAYNTGKESWSIYFQGALKQAISFSKPLYFQNDTMKGIWNACFTCEITTDFLEKFRRTNDIEILMLEANGDMIVTTIPDVNVSKLVWIAAKSRWEGRKINAVDSTNPLIRDVYLNYLNNSKNEVVDSKYVKYASLSIFKSNSWIIAVMTDKFATDWPFYSTLIINVVILFVFLVLSLIVANIITFLITKLYIRPLSNNIEKLGKFSLFSKDIIPMIIPIEFNESFQYIKRISNILNRILRWVPDHVINELRDLKKSEKGVNMTSLIITLGNGVEKIEELFKSLDNIAQNFYSQGLTLANCSCDKKMMFYSTSNDTASNFILNVYSNENFLSSKIVADSGKGKFFDIGSEKVSSLLIGKFTKRMFEIDSEVLKLYKINSVITEKVYFGITSDSIRSNWVFIDIIKLRGWNNSIAIFSYLPALNETQKFTMRKIYQSIKTSENLETLKSKILNLFEFIPNTFFENFKKKFESEEGLKILKDYIDSNLKKKHK